MLEHVVLCKDVQVFNVSYAQWKGFIGVADLSDSNTAHEYRIERWLPCYKLCHDINDDPWNNCNYFCHFIWIFSNYQKYEWEGNFLETAYYIFVSLK
jgi:hypothetical protein